ncbi:MAG TPA: hypothetical protein VIW23_10325 [Candidatus Acidoferrum sp.]|jgi:YHS domain-containing protein
MGFIGRFLRFVFWVVIVSWVIKLVGRMLSRGDRQPADQGTGHAEETVAGRPLVRDPVCGIHMAKELALPLSTNGETQYFCSQECRAKYESSMLRRAANG